jgi:hypothetical protein
VRARRAVAGCPARVGGSGRLRPPVVAAARCRWLVAVPVAQRSPDAGDSGRGAARSGLRGRVERSATNRETPASLATESKLIAPGLSAFLRSAVIALRRVWVARLRRPRPRVGNCQIASLVLSRSPATLSVWIPPINLVEVRCFPPAGIRVMRNATGVHHRHGHHPVAAVKMRRPAGMILHSHRPVLDHLVCHARSRHRGRGRCRSRISPGACHRRRGRGVCPAGTGNRRRTDDSGRYRMPGRRARPEVPEAVAVESSQAFGRSAQVVMDDDVLFLAILAVGGHASCRTRRCVDSWCFSVRIRRGTRSCG